MGKVRRSQHLETGYSVGTKFKSGTRIATFIAAKGPHTKGMWIYDAVYCSHIIRKISIPRGRFFSSVSKLISHQIKCTI